ncbi:MAG: type II secretion system minor pseudopilin GspH [Pseudomonadota bacterium]|nr:type II secretion system minor pseudopilin GspH [Pseudomonadota bacterium]
MNPGSSTNGGGPRCDGFTLLEMLLVVFLIGLTAGYIVLKMDRDEDQIARLEANRFATLLNHIRDESVLTGRPLAVEVDDFEGTYRFLRLDKDKWASVDNDTVLRERRFPDFLEVEFKLLQKAGKDEQKKGKKKKQLSIVVVEPTGILTPFLLSVAGEKESFGVTVDDLQSVIVGRHEEPR